MIYSRKKYKKYRMFIFNKDDATIADQTITSRSFDDAVQACKDLARNLVDAVRTLVVDSTATPQP